MVRVRSSSLLVLVLAVGLWGLPDPGAPAVASHSTGRWSAHGPSAGSVRTVEVGNDGTVYAGTGGAGVFASRDGGSTWQRRGSGLPPDAYVSGIAVSPSTPSRVYLSTYAHGAYRSDDAGASWRRIHPAATVSDIAVDPTDADIVYLGDAGGTNAKSVDGGATWTGLTIPNRSTFASDVVEVAPSDPAVVYATDPPLLVRSDDGGATWHGTGSSTTFVEDLAVHPTDPDVVYAATVFDTVQKSTDGGVTWTAGTGLPDIATHTVEIDRSRPSTVYAGTARGGYAYRSVDAGATWQRYRVATANGAVEHLASAAGGVVYAGTTYNGVFRSVDRGATWTRRGNRIVGADVRALVTVPSSPAVVYAGTMGDGVHRTTDSGRTWARRGLAGRRVNDLAVHRSRPRTVYAATDRGIHRTIDGGRTWRLATSRFAGASAVAVAPSDPAVVYATRSGSVIRSVDAGRTWRRLRVPDYADYTAVAVHPTRPATAWVGTAGSQGTVLRTGDGGRTWRSAAACPLNYPALDLAVDTRRPWVVYAGCESNGLYRSRDRGATWRRITPDAVDTVTDVVVDPARSGRLYVGTYSGRGVSGVYRSVDGGVTWRRFSTGMTTTWTHALAITATSSRLHAGTTGYGLDGGGGGVFTYRLK